MSNTTTFLKLYKEGFSPTSVANEDGYEVHFCTYDFSKKHDKKGLNFSPVSGGLIHINLPIPPPDELFNWLFDTQKRMNGMLTTMDLHEKSIEKLQFRSARIVDFKLIYAQDAQHGINTVFTINAQHMAEGDLEYENIWK